MACRLNMPVTSSILCKLLELLLNRRIKEQRKSQYMYMFEDINQQNG